MKDLLRKGLSVLLTLTMTLGAGVVSAAAAEGTIDYSSYKKGVTVEADAASPTGYTATFVYEEQKSYDGLSGEIAKVELYSDCMMLFSYDEVKSGTSINDGSDFTHNPSEFKPGFYPAGGSGATTYAVEMTKFADSLWGVQVPLTSGAFVYNFRVTDASGNVMGRLDDPNNPTLTNSATNIRSLSSMVYVPYDAKTMGTGKWADRSVELPQANASKRGKVETVSYTGADNTKHGLAVYLPAGYDANRSEPYKVLYLSHGTSGDVYGDELRWMNEGAAANIMDNLIAQGKTEPFVVVTMNNQQFSKGEGHQGPDWDYSQIEKDQIEYIMPYVEKNYNVSKEAGGRAYAGLSMGGHTASNMLLYHGDLFSYYGVWSYANLEDIQKKDIQDALAALKVKPHVMTGAGSWDWLYTTVKDFDAELGKLNIDHSFLEVPGGHDWENWQLVYAYAAENFFWKSEEPAPANTFTDVDAASPYAAGIRWAVSQGITNGTSATTFSPSNTCTRAQIVTFLWRAAGKPAPTVKVSPFSDVTNGMNPDFYNAILWASEKGMAEGDTFAPNAPCTRLMAVEFMWKAAGSPEAASAPFTDVANNGAVNWAVAQKITQGTTATTFAPSNTCTRGQIVTFLYRQNNAA